jgi:hypothetical protein
VVVLPASDPSGDRHLFDANDIKAKVHKPI